MLDKLMTTDVLPFVDNDVSVEFTIAAALTGELMKLHEAIGNLQSINTRVST